MTASNQKIAVLNKKMTVLNRKWPFLIKNDRFKSKITVFWKIRSFESKSNTKNQNFVLRVIFVLKYVNFDPGWSFRREIYHLFPNNLLAIRIKMTILTEIDDFQLKMTVFDWKWQFSTKNDKFWPQISHSKRPVFHVIFFMLIFHAYFYSKMTFLRKIWYIVKKGLEILVNENILTIWRYFGQFLF